MTPHDAAEAAGRCECGVPLDTHEPLPMPPPLASWKAQRTLAVSFGRIEQTEAQLAARQLAVLPRGKRPRGQALRVVPIAR